MKSKYRSDLDMLKGFAILAVVLYHLGVSRSGYLGVDVFLTLGGFFVVPKAVQEVARGSFRYPAFVERRLVRLLPLLLLATFLSLALGYWGMLPDDYENLSESVVATNFFSNNILAYLTTNDYWDVGNDYKPLMHTWFVGILMEFYLVFPLVLMLLRWLAGKWASDFRKSVMATFLALSVVSLLFYLSPSVSDFGRFYLPSCRFFELSFGGVAGLWVADRRGGELSGNGMLSAAGFLVLMLLLFAGVVYVEGSPTDLDLVTGCGGASEHLIPPVVLPPLVVMLTLLFVCLDNMQSRIVSWLVGMRFFCLLGSMSYSLFIWHQPLLAFWRYFVSSAISAHFIANFLVLVFVLSYVSYRLVERKVRVGMHTRVVLSAAFVLISGTAFWIYLHAGVVRDVPELDIRRGEVHRNMHAEYVDRIYSYDHDFPPDGNGKLNVFVVGHSFARDWANVLLESEMASRINLSYAFSVGEEEVGRIRQADYIFLCDWKHNVPALLWDNVKKGGQVWGVGTKKFGESSGIVYRNRRRHDYFSQTVPISPVFIAMNERLKAEWGDHYIDLLGLSLAGECRVRAFSDDHKLLSQDTRHFTRGGARYFARRIDFARIFH